MEVNLSACLVHLCAFFVFGLSTKISAIEEFGRTSSEGLTEPDLKGYAPGDVRCYCNLPSCVPTGYMCKSEKGICFSDLFGNSKDVANGRYGCVELLDDIDNSAKCENLNIIDGWSRGRSSHPKSLLLCCFKNVCNHVDSPEARSKLNDTLLSSGLMLKESSKTPQTEDPPHTYTNADVWFKVATIVVPILGAVILLLLIGLAVKMLRSDAGKLGGQYNSPMNIKTNIDHYDNGQQHVKKVPLLCQHSSINTSGDTVAPLLVQNVTHNHDHKNEQNARMNIARNINVPSLTPHVKLYNKPVIPTEQ